MQLSSFYGIFHVDLPTFRLASVYFFCSHIPVGDYFSRSN